MTVKRGHIINFKVPAFSRFKGCSLSAASARITARKSPSRRFPLSLIFAWHQPRPQGLRGVQNGGFGKTLANSRTCDLKLANHKARCQFETIKISNIFGDTWPAVCQGLFRVAILNDEKTLWTRLAWHPKFHGKELFYFRSYKLQLPFHWCLSDTNASSLIP